MVLEHFLNLMKEFSSSSRKEEKKKCFQALACSYHIGLHLKIGLPSMVWVASWTRGPPEITVNLNYPMTLSYNHIYLLDDYQ